MIGECESCHYETAEVKEYPFHRLSPKREGSKYLCLLCASTQAGTAIEYPELSPDRSGDILQAICYVGNAILDAIEKRGSK